MEDKEPLATQERLGLSPELTGLNFPVSITPSLEGDKASKDDPRPPKSQIEINNSSTPLHNGQDLNKDTMS